MEDPYLLIMKLGEGALGSVYKMHCPTTKPYYSQNTIVAVKRIKNQHSEQDHEVDILKKLQHKSIIQYLDSFNDETTQDLCIVMEFCNRGTLTELIGNEKQEKDVWRFATSMSGALHYLHGQHPPIIHQDLKPDNILCNSTDTGFRTKIADFGIAKIMNKKAVNMYYTKNAGGTICYMAPETLRQGGRVGTSADMWSLGAVISAYCNKGKHLFRSEFEVLGWEGGKSTLDRNRYTISLRQLTADLLTPMAVNRPTAKTVNEEGFKDNRQYV
eukprot:GFUD01009679.1.p1 GENE.GFUD01009679.1~~GFUD01009679.1.p1  ORF type:complete len:271 (+),score=47.57 GFUD01009679.1:74-886(+)